MILIADKSWLLLPEDRSTPTLSRTDGCVLPLGTYISTDEGMIYLDCHKALQFCFYYTGGVPIQLIPRSLPRIRRIFSRGDQTPQTSAVRNIPKIVWLENITDNRILIFRSALLAGTNYVAWPKCLTTVPRTADITYFYQQLTFFRLRTWMKYVLSVEIYTLCADSCIYSGYHLKWHL